MDKYTHMTDLSMLGFLSNALDPRSREGNGDTGCSFPRSDAEDLSRGARFIPGEVTMERRAGRRVQFVSECSPCCWYWQLESGTRIYHFDRYTYDRIKVANGIPATDTNGAGPCPDCGNAHTSGGPVTKDA